MKKILFPLMLCFCAVCFCSADLEAQTINFSEPVDGELSGSNANPTDLLVFGVGNNTVGGTVVNAGGALENVDVFTFDIAAGTQLDTISLNIFNSADNLAFVGIDDSNAFPFNSAQLLAPGGPDQTQFIGGLLFGKWWRARKCTWAAFGRWCYRIRGFCVLFSKHRRRHELLLAYFQQFGSSRAR